MLQELEEVKDRWNNL